MSISQTAEQRTNQQTAIPADEISLMELWLGIRRHLRPIGMITLLVTTITAAGVFLWPPSYTAEAVILPPQQQQSSLTAMAAGAIGGGLSGVASGLGIKTPGDLYVGLFKSRTIAENIVKKFGLQQIYGEKKLSDARKILARNTTFSSGKDTLIYVSVEDRDPKRAADIANSYVDELFQQNTRLALTEASQRRLFFEQQLLQEKNALADAEVALKNIETSTGLVVPTGQAEALIRMGTQLRAEIASREVKLQALRTYATDQNPQVQVIEREIQTLQGQLGQLEATGEHNRGGMAIPAGKLPEASLQYIRKMRDVKYHETLFELLAKQYEAARIDEAKSAPIVQVVDRADTPDKRSWPPRGLIIVLGVIAGAVGATAYYLVADSWRIFGQRESV
jgi:uncharacterized protein involved in exopolysaccharide biosynthesis